MKRGAMRDSGRGRYLHNVGKRRNSTAGGNDVLPYSRGHFHVEARGRRKPGGITSGSLSRKFEPISGHRSICLSTLETRIVTSIDV